MSLEIKNLSKIIHLKNSQNSLFENISISFPESGMIGVTGKSGCGKTSLLHIIAGIDQDYQGQVLIDRKDIRYLPDYTRQYIAMVYQNYRLFDFLNVYENCLIFNKLKGLAIPRKEVEKLLTIFDLQSVRNKMPAQLSGGQKQKVALVRALLTKCPIILCDEPTGALNTENKILVYQYLKKYSKTHLIIIVSHDFRIKDYCDYIIDFQQLQNDYVFPCQKYHFYKGQPFYKNYSLFKESLKMLWFEKTKLIIIFLSQILLFMTITLLISGIQGLKNNYSKMHQTEINNQLIYISKKNKDAFSNEELTKLHAHYQYLLEAGKIRNVDYFQSSPIESKMKENEVIVNQAFYQINDSRKIKYTVLNNEFLLNIKRIIDDGYEEPIIYYSSSSLPEKLKVLTVDLTTCYHFTDDYLQVSAYIDALDSQYEGICFVEQKYEAYEQLIEFSQMVCLIFVGLCVVIVIVLMFFVLLSMFLELQKYYVIFLSNGMSFYRYYLFIFKKILLICLNNAFFSSVFCIVILFLAKTFDLSQVLLGISDIFLFPVILGTPYALYFIYGLFYCGIGLILFVIMAAHLKRINLIRILREE